MFPSLPSLYISGKFGVVIVLDVCSHVGLFYLPVVFFHSFVIMVFIIIIIIIIIIFALVNFDQLPLNVFQCDCCSYFVMS